MKRLFVSLMVALTLPLISQASNNLTVVCSAGGLGGALPLEQVPTYDYGSDGMVRFHYTWGVPGWDSWWPFAVTYQTYDNQCQPQGVVGSDNTHARIDSGLVHLMLQAVREDTGTYNFIAVNEDTGDPIDMGGLSGSFSNPIASVRFFVPHGYKNMYGYYEDYVETPAVPVIDPDYTEAKRPILIIPGVTGTDIKQENELLWANLKMLFGVDDFMDPLAFTTNLTPSVFGLVPGSVIRKRVTLDYTEGLIEELKNEGYIEGEDLFTFPYDWRYGVSGVVNSATGENIVSELKGQIEYILNQTDAGRAAGKVDVIAHSTGGLLVKKYVAENPTSHHIGKAVFVGVPNLGAPKALKMLLSGDNLGMGFLDPLEMKKISQNMPVIYDLAPFEEYYNQAGSYLYTVKKTERGYEGTGLDFSETMANLNGLGLVNSLAMAKSSALHSEEFDNLDLREKGVDLYSIVGCQSPTYGTVLELIDGSSVKFEFPKIVSGDQTVPFASADSLMVDANKTYFVPKVGHSNLMSADGPRQQIVNLLTHSTLSTGGKVLTHSEVQNRPDMCAISGEYLKIHSPVALQISDQDGNVAQVDEYENIQNDIPGSSYDVEGEEKYIFLPTENGQIYSVNMKGTGNGSYTIENELIVNGEVAETQVFSNLPVTTELRGKINLAGAHGTTALVLDTDNDGIADQTVEPSSIISANQAQDVIPPVSTSTISGPMGQQGFYRGDVTVALTASDPIISNHPDQTSGVLSTAYNLDGGGYQLYSSTTPLVVSGEGSHSVTFFSTDRAGNNEPEHTIIFTIDKTPPEFSLQFSPLLKDIVFTATDTLPTILIASTSTSTRMSINKIPIIPPVKIIDNDSIITATDAAGNTTEMVLKGKSRKISLKTDIQSLSYNGTPADISKSLLHFDWLFDKKGELKLLTQQVKTKNDFNILSLYALRKTVIAGKDEGGMTSTVMNGLVLLKIMTHEGNFNWGY